MSGREYFNKGQSAFISGNHAESIKMFGKALQEGYEPARTLLSRGAAFLQTQDFDRALDDFDQVLAREPDNERAYYYRGITRINKGAFQEAVEDLDKAIARNPERGVAFLARGIAKAELERDEDAAEDFKQAVAYSQLEVEQFLTMMGSNRTSFQRSLALVEGERGPVTTVLDEAEIEKLKTWME